MSDQKLSEEIQQDLEFVQRFVGRFIKDQYVGNIVAAAFGAAPALWAIVEAIKAPRNAPSTEPVSQ